MGQPRNSHVLHTLGVSLHRLPGYARGTEETTSTADKRDEAVARTAQLNRNVAFLQASDAAAASASRFESVSKRGKHITQVLCALLAPRVATIRLSVKTDNASAIHCYARIGFREIVRYEEGVLARHAR